MPPHDHEIALLLRIDLNAQPISGSLTDPDGTCRRFSGWIELSAALERARAAEPPPHPLSFES